MFNAGILIKGNEMQEHITLFVLQAFLINTSLILLELQACLQICSITNLTNHLKANSGVKT